MDIVTASAKGSSLLNTLSKAAQTDPYSYRLLSNYPSASLTCVAINPQTAASASAVSQDLTFRLPQYGLMAGAVLRSTLTTGGNNSAIDNTNLGERVFSNISIRSSNKVIVQQTPESCEVRGLAGNFEQNVRHNKLTNSALTWNVATNAAISVNTPVYSTLFDKSSNYLDLSFIENLELVASINSLAGMGAGQAITANTITLYVWYIALDSDEHKALIAKNYPPSEPLVMLVSDVAVENVAMANGSTSTSINLRGNHAISSFHCMAHSATNLGTDLAISDLTLSVSGRNIISALPADIIEYRNTNFGDANVNLTRSSGAITFNDALKPTSWYFSMVPDRTFNSGSLSLAGVNAPTITVTHADPGANRTLKVMYEYWKFVTVDPASGRIDIGVSI